MTVGIAVRRCVACAAPLPTTGRRDRRYCGGACRAAASTRRRRHGAVDIDGTAAAIPPELQQALDSALAEPRLVALVAAAAGKGQWRAAAWMLERRYPERWGQGRTGNAEPDDLGADPFAEVDELAARRREQRRPSE
jgi:hypothetical protein